MALMTMTHRPVTRGPTEPRRGMCLAVLQALLSGLFFYSFHILFKVFSNDLFISYLLEKVSLYVR